MGSGPRSARAEGDGEGVGETVGVGVRGQRRQDAARQQQGDEDRNGAARAPHPT